MARLFSIGILAVVILMVPCPTPAATLDTAGQGQTVTCQTPSLIQHTITAEGNSQFKFHGQCFYSQGDSAWNKWYSITTSWNGNLAREIVKFDTSTKTGIILSTCPSDPWLQDVTCQLKSMSGNAFEDFQISGVTAYPLTRSAISAEQKAQFRAELDALEKEAACAAPTLVLPSPALDQQFIAPASIQIQVKHNPDFPPHDWTFKWAPPTPAGQWPATPTQQNVALTNLTTANGITTGALNAAKLGSWHIKARVDYPSFCNKTGQALIDARCQVIENPCNAPVLLLPSPASGQQFTAPASIQIRVKHNPDFPPHNWTFFWTPPTPAGQWPATPTQQNVTLTNLTTANGITTATLNTTKAGSWQIRARVDYPSSCHKNGFATINASFTIKAATTVMPAPKPTQQIKPITPTRTLSIPASGT
ncbi:MAG: hypothetical protein JXB25_07575 [Deltaproteobacteria bacterium]|nr:hypothetical protein [Deltaproteobacteria bacterium]